MGRNEELDDLIATFNRLVHEEHPNPERRGCPGTTALMRLAGDASTLETELILGHVRQCAACIDELRGLRQAIKRPLQ